MSKQREIFDPSKAILFGVDYADIEYRILSHNDDAWGKLSEVLLGKVLFGIDQGTGDSFTVCYSPLSDRADRRERAGTEPAQSPARPGEEKTMTKRAREIIQAAGVTDPAAVVSYLARWGGIESGGES